MKHFSIFSTNVCHSFWESYFNFLQFVSKTKLVVDRDKPRNSDLLLWTSSMDWDDSGLPTGLLNITQDPSFDNVLLKHCGLPYLFPLSTW